MKNFKNFVCEIREAIGRDMSPYLNATLPKLGPEPFLFLRELKGRKRDYSGQARNLIKGKSAVTTKSYKRFHFSPFFTGFGSNPVGDASLSFSKR